MARSRNIKPGFFANENLAELSLTARLLFIGLWTIADRSGRLEDRPKRIKGQLFPYDSFDIEDALTELANSSEQFIVRYEVEGQRYIQITNFSKHQNPHKNEAQSIIPPATETAPYKHHTSTIQEQETHDTTHADSLLLIPDSLNPITSSLNSESDADDDASQVNFVKTYEQEFGRPISPTEYDSLLSFIQQDNMDEAVVCEAIKRARKESVLKLSYVEGILKNWLSAGIKTMAAVSIADEQRDKQKVTPIRGKPEKDKTPAKKSRYEDLYMS